MKIIVSKCRTIIFATEPFHVFILGSAEAQREDPLLQVGDESGASQVS
jgi:hypothetical protein